MIPLTAVLAAAMVGKTTSSVLTDSAIGTSRQITFVAIPSVPSEPTYRPVRS